MANPRVLLGSVLLGCLMAAQSWAAESHAVKLNHAAALSGVYLRAAVYDIRWAVSGTDATVIFSRAGHAVATVPGKWSIMEKKVANDTVYYRKDSYGGLYITGLGFANSNGGVLFPVVRPVPRHSLEIGSGLGAADQDWLGQDSPEHFRRPIGTR